ncbi:hypothetical protein QCA50_015237 [Cerrena zonata]|uniref:Uncharacterized protein n=1 Tax=Cerrena zonata TaxID=2478898 RepID=A0AAW0FXP7_9APHY
MSSTRQTRASNVNAHPGQVVLDSTQKRRPKGEVDAEKAAVVAKKEQKSLAKAARIYRLSEIQQQEVRAARKASKDELLASRLFKPTEAVTMKLPLAPTATPQPKARMTEKVKRTDIEERFARDAAALDADSDSSDVEFVRMVATAVGKKRALPSAIVPSSSEVHSKKAKLNSPHGFRQGWSPRETPHVKIEPGTESQQPGNIYSGFVSDNDNDDSAEGSAAPRNGVPASQVAKSIKPLAIVKYKPASASPSTATLGRAPRRANGSPSVTMAHLPADIDPVIWTKHFIPTCIDILGEHHEPFFMTDPEIIHQIAQAFVVCFPGLKHEITIESMVFKVLSQRCCEWRNKCSSSAQDAVTEFLNETPGLETSEARAEYVDGLGVGSTCDYLYEQTTPVHRGCFRSDFVLKTFAYHLNAVEGTIRDSPYPAVGALGLAAVAVERALLMYKTGTLAISDSRRDDNPQVFSAVSWSNACSEMVSDIFTLDDVAWKDVYALSSQFVKKRGKVAETTGRDTDTNCPRQRQRAIIRDAPDN